MADTKDSTRWTLHGDEVRDANGRVVAEVPLPVEGMLTSVQNELYGNACLIVAAPAMRAKLLEVRKFCPVSVQDEITRMIEDADGQS